jgi:predicted GNAT superfamily acetyltransferase
MTPRKQIRGMFRFSGRTLITFKTLEGKHSPNFLWNLREHFNKINYSTKIRSFMIEALW